MKINIIQGAFFPIPPKLGGAVEKVWYELGKGFAEAGHDVTHVGRHYETQAEQEFSDSVKYIRVKGYNAPRNMLVYKLFDLLYTLRAIKVLPPADILVTHTFWAPIIAPRHKKGQIYVHVARFPKGQLKFYKKAAMLQTVSTAVLKEMQNQCLDLQDRFSMIPNFVKPESSVPINCTKKYDLVYAGRVHPEKGIDLLVSAAAKIANKRGGLKLLIVGPWKVEHGGGGVSYVDKIKKTISNTNLEIEWSGPEFDHAKYLARISLGRVFVYPSLAEKGESFGVAPLEAMMLGIPTIVSGLTCFRDFVVHEKSGLVFDHLGSNPVENLSEQIEVIFNNPMIESSLSENGKVVAESEFSFESVRDKYLQDFRSMLKTS